MAKPRMYGMQTKYIPNSQADQRKKRFKRKSKTRKAVKGNG